VLGHRLVVLADAHLGVAPAAVEDALLAFLEAVPSLGDSLLVNGDLFDFWFSYGRVIPRHGFRTASALARLGRRLPVVLVGGNHDRWDRGFWRREAGVRFHSRRVEFDVGRRRVLALHGDGVTEPRRRALLLHRLIHHPATAAVFRLLHPDVGFRVVDLLSPVLGHRTPDERLMDEAARRQRKWAEGLLLREPDLGLVVMGHTHRRALTEPAPGRYYLNPGAWMDGFRYAAVTEAGAELHSFDPAGAAAALG
jgi:UDP-2,3-diacylglucosamine hydrolase